MIVVGMRFHDPNWRKKVLVGDTLMLRTEANDKSSFVFKGTPSAIAVYGNWPVSPKLIGFIREADLSNKLLETCAYNTGTFTPTVEVEHVHEYYIKTNGIVPPSVVSNWYDATSSSSTNANNPIKKEEPKMSINANSMRDQIFREVKNVAIDIQSGKFGITSSEGISVYDNGGVSVNPITDFGIKVPAFAMRIAVADLVEGDIILSGNDASFFKQAVEGGYEVVTLNGEVKRVGSVTNLFFGKNTVLAVKNMFGGASGMNPMMLAMMMGDNKEGFDMKTFALMSMMGGQNAGDMNPMLMAMMLAK